MESLSYSFEGRRLLFTDDTDFAVDGLMRGRNLLKNWDAAETVGFVEPVLPDMSRKSVLSNQCSENSGNDTGDHSGKSPLFTSTIKLNSLMELGTRFSCSVNKTSDEKLAALRVPNGTRFSTDNSVLSSSEPSVSAKRTRITNLQSQIPTCQVHGCNKDLSSSKDYHKRHKVCDVHSKTAVVIVNGIKQRFCQQCSRFHILAEFDEGKRSCRKRLAGHNERRRKPQFDTHLGSSYFPTDASSSLLFSGILPSGLFSLQCNEPTSHSRHLNLDYEPSPISQLALHTKFGQSLPQPVRRLRGNIGQQYPSKNCLNAPLSVPELSAGSNSSHALSLLSVQSHNTLSNSAGMSIVHPLISKENYHTTLCTVQNSVSDDASASVGLEAPRNEVSQESSGLNIKSHLSPEGANTVDLIELSLHLQRVEQQKYYAEVKLENDVFCQSTTT